MAKQKVFLVDDDSDILVLNRDFLESEGYDVVTATNCAEALEKIKLHNFSCIVLDVMLPDGSAFDLAPKIKEYTDCPIIFLTARDTEDDTVKGFNLGADDYISKPFSLREVLVRIRAVLRRSQEKPDDSAHVVRYRGLEMNSDTKTVTVDGSPVPFTKTEFSLLYLLLTNKGRVFSRQELIQRIWPNNVMVVDRTVDVNITRIRKKVGIYADAIVTRLGFGYYFEG